MFPSYRELLLLLQEVIDPVGFRPQVLISLLQTAVSTDISISKTFQCCLDLSFMCTTQWPVWDLGSGLPVQSSKSMACYTDQMCAHTVMDESGNCLYHLPRTFWCPGALLMVLQPENCGFIHLTLPHISCHLCCILGPSDRSTKKEKCQKEFTPNLLGSWLFPSETKNPLSQCFSVFLLLGSHLLLQDCLG